MKRWLMTWGIVCLLLTTAAQPSLAEPVKPLALHPDNPHYFLFRGKAAVSPTSGEHYGAGLNLDFDYVRYLDMLQAASPDTATLTRAPDGDALPVQQ
jgi:hypothetical protein